MKAAALKLLHEAERVQEDRPKILAAFRMLAIENGKDIPLKQGRWSAGNALGAFMALDIPARFKKERTLKRWWTVARAYPWTPENLLAPHHKERIVARCLSLEKMEAMSRLPEIERARLLRRHWIRMPNSDITYSLPILVKRNTDYIRKLMRGKS